MKLRGLRPGDIVRLVGDDSALWIIMSRERGTLRVVLPGRPLTQRSVTSRQVAEAWRKVRTQ